MGDRRTSKLPRATHKLLKPGVLAAMLAMAGCGTLPSEQTASSSAPGEAVAPAREPAAKPADAPLPAEPPQAQAASAPPKVSPGSDAAAVGTAPTAPVEVIISVRGPGENLETLTPPPAPVEKQPDAVAHKDIWDRIRAGFRLPELDSPLVDRHARRYAADPEYLERICERARLYLHYIVTEVEKRNMPLEIALLPAIESAYHPHAYSRARAMGLWQFIAPTARLYGIQVDWWYDGRRDVVTATRAALDYLEKLHNDFNGDWFLALAAYNAGEGAIQRRIDENRRRGRPTGYQDLRLVSETRNYVPKLMAFARIVSNPSAYGVSLPAVANEPYFAEVDAGGQIDLAIVSQLASVDMAELRSINAGFNRIATPPDGPHRILVPVNREPALTDALQRLPANARVRWQRHHVKPGDTLGGIAGRYGVSVQEVQRANELKGTLIRAGRDLMIPISSQPFSLRTASAAAAQLAVKPASADPAKVEHRVRHGETLWSIARQYNVHVAQLEEWNAISDSDTLRVDQRLQIFTSARTN